MDESGRIASDGANVESFVDLKSAGPSEPPD
jgi:hypothetical protein